MHVLFDMVIQSRFYDGLVSAAQKVCCAGEGRAIPRVDTFASNLHDSWGAHAQHDSPPAEDSTLHDPPRLSTESVRSAASQASKASSGRQLPM